MDIYYAIGLGLSVGFCFLEWKKEKFSLSCPAIERKEVYLYLIFIFLFFISRYLKFDEMGVWNDEYTQFKHGNQLYEKLSIYFSFEQQQPPLDYFLHGLWGNLIGQNIYSLKIGSILNSFIFLISIPWGMRVVVNNIWARWAPVFLIGFSRSLMIFSLEARPISLSILLGFFFFYFCISYIKDKKGFGWLLLTEFLFIQSTGLQPQLLIFVTLVTGMILLIKEQKEMLAKKVLASGIISFFIQLPVLYYLVTFTDKTNQFHRGLDTVLDSLKRSGGLLLEFLIDEVYICFFFAFILVSFVRTIKKKEWIDLTYFIIPLAFVLALTLSYNLFISYHFNIRYFLCFLGPFAFLISFVAQDWINTSGDKFVIGLITILTGFNFYYSTYPNIASFHMGFERSDWKGVYKYLEENGSEKDLILRMSLREFGKSRRCRYPGKIFFMKEKLSQRMMGFTKVSQLDYPNCVSVDDRFDLKQKGESLYIIQSLVGVPKRLRWALEIKGREESRYFGGLLVLKLEVKENFYLTYRTYLRKILGKSNDREIYAPAFETLMHLELTYGSDPGLFEWAFLNYKKLNYSDSTESLSIPKEDFHQRRILYFKEKALQKWPELRNRLN